MTHETNRLMLLGSPPDMVRRYPLRKTGSAAVCGGVVEQWYSTIFQKKYQQKNEKGASQIQKSVL